MTHILKNSILIVDDTPNNIRVLFDILHGAGFKVSVVKSGELALEKVSFIKPDLILLDVMMPGIDGFETCRRLKLDENTREIPIIFMTALSDVQNKVKGLQLGAVDYITKPIQVEEVIARVNVHLALRNMQLKLQNEVTQRSQAQAQLQQTLNELQQAQTQLVQSEKMSSLGQLVAGVAHEINNPVNFIYGNLSHAHIYTQDLLKLIQIYQQYYPKSVPEIEAEVKAIDFTFLIQDLPKVLKSMQVGAERIREIVLSLRVFSRLDEAEMKEVNIHEGIDSTLMILGHRLKNKSCRDIQIIKKYDNLPLIECYAGQLNQVFMNIISNAIDAIEEALEHQNIFTPCIRIQTELIDNKVAIRIADNGLGIPQEIKQRIFDPFYTTKPIGIGTGMGLAISYQIVKDRHHGSLSCVSHPGEGTEFIIAIPLKQNVA
ncbi:response regulator receiver sensor signal transduction histidine kinase [Tolypothrix sp. NIES-4075]|uniref:hybrid sensor histidine kinase/response regulator n=1 Tax=Tolypothrix sp. NIES-4075 TaxID=2005459 RepID=UPI000B5C5B56|nr:response regulator [Tolypothrix sp. NIES-4075]GAX42962.1 response regulator receiver sensor signal transduction histidine kinase [Tolypothrix sp. NIES-4075]